MNRNIIEEYIKFLEKNYRQIFAFLTVNKYDRKLVDKYLQTYFTSRYYNYHANKESTLKKVLRDIQSEIKEYDIDTITTYNLVFDYVLYLEDFNDDNNLTTVIKKIITQGFVKIESLLELENQQDLIRKIKNFLEKRNEYLSLDRTDTFKLNFEKIGKNTELIKISHNVKISKLYSSYAVNKVFTQGIISEDKLFIEYSLLSFKILKDMLGFNKLQHYVLEFEPELFLKKSKTSRLFNTIDNQIIKDYTSFLVTYKQFLKHKKEFESIIRDGYHITVILDEEFICDEIHLQRLVIFEKILIDSKYQCYDFILENKKLIKPQILISR